MNRTPPVIRSVTDAGDGCFDRLRPGIFARVDPIAQKKNKNFRDPWNRFG